MTAIKIRSPARMAKSSSCWVMSDSLSKPSALAIASLIKLNKLLFGYFNKRQSYIVLSKSKSFFAFFP